MIIETELFDMGWRRYGDQENDPYYKIHFKSRVFGVDSLSGNLNSNGFFSIYSMDHRNFNKIHELQEIMRVNRFEVDWDISNRYGSKIPLEQITK